MKLTKKQKASKLAYEKLNEVEQFAFHGFIEKSPFPFNLLKKNREKLNQAINAHVKYNSFYREFLSADRFANHF